MDFELHVEGHGAHLGPGECAVSSCVRVHSALNFKILCVLVRVNQGEAGEVRIPYTSVIKQPRVFGIPYPIYK